MSRPSRPVEVRFWEKVEKFGFDKCWIWKSCKNDNGYGRLTTKNKKRVMAHRFSYELKNGKIPKNMNVLHRCDNPSCVNPDHLFIGTQKDNIHDMITKGRSRGNFKLTKKDVEEIRKKAKTKKRGIQKKLAEQYNVHYSTISDVVRKKTWNI